MLVRVHLAYAWRHRRPLDLDNPQRFTELVQRRKLYGHDPRLPLPIDKVNLKRVVAQQLGEEWVTLTWWSGLHFTAKGGLHIPQWLSLEPGGHAVHNRLVVRKLGRPSTKLSASSISSETAQQSADDDGYKRLWAVAGSR